jgi:hypothetical protein
MRNAMDAMKLTSERIDDRVLPARHDGRRKLGFDVVDAVGVETATQLDMRDVLNHRDLHVHCPTPC